MEKWELLEYFTSLPDDSVPLKRFANNLELMGEIESMDCLTVTDH